MKIGFDAKRAFHNNTGLGNYSRTLIEGLAVHYPEHEYFLFNPKSSDLYRPDFKNVFEVQPSRFLEKKLSSIWRSNLIKKDLQQKRIDLFHGLSHEIPFGLKNMRSVVTIHDLIFERYPEQFNFIDVQIYRKKVKHACKNANHVIAISHQTKKDLIDLYKVDEARISVCYQSCNPLFSGTVEEDEKEKIRDELQLPEEFFLYVGSIIERKNLLNICKAFLEIKNKIDIPLVVIGNGKKYKKKVIEFIKEHQLEQKIIFLTDRIEMNSQYLNDPKRLAAIYQMSVAFIYPSFYEGFGIPVLEALTSRLPVITSDRSSLPEVGGEAAYYINPDSSTEIAEAMLKIYSDSALRNSMMEKGVQHALNFTLEKCTRSVMDVYKKLM